MPTNWKQVRQQLKGFKSEKSTLRALEEIESGNVTIHPDPEGKREAVRRRIEEEKRRKEEEEKKIKEQIAKEKKMVKKFKVGGLNLIFLLQECTDKEEVRRWL